MIAGLGGFLEYRVSEVLVKGITFEGARQASFAMNVEGSVKFQDCIFRVRGKCARVCVSSISLLVFLNSFIVSVPRGL
jgi:hypothetical protein